MQYDKYSCVGATFCLHERETERGDLTRVLPYVAMSHHQRCTLGPRPTDHLEAAGEKRPFIGIRDLGIYWNFLGKSVCQF